MTALKFGYYFVCLNVHQYFVVNYSGIDFFGNFIFLVILFEMIFFLFTCMIIIFFLFAVLTLLIPQWQLWVRKP